MSSFRRFRGALLAALLVLVGCESEEYAILISAYGDQGFAANSDVDVTVRDLQSSLRATSPRISLADEISRDVPLRIGIQLHGAGQYLVHVAATGAGATLSATRCYSVLGVTRSEVLLVPVDELDSDGDTWPTEETCRERMAVEGEVAEIGCKNQCPTEWAVDCDDSSLEINPGAPEQCEDDVDQDCDGEDARCEDADGDGFTGCRPDAADTSSCDCDDGKRTVNPGVVESSDPGAGLCENDVDDDCDGEDQRCDGDGDGVASCAEDAAPGESCDCDDSSKDVFPGATETPGGECDGLDNNCNGLVDEVSACLSDDLDGDGSTVGDDCNDCNAGAKPGATQIVCGNGIDEDCSGGDETCSAGDADGDGYVSEGAGGSDCDDGDAAIYPDAPDECGGGSSDCSGADSTCEDDGDSDGWSSENDCDDADSTVNPERPEICNGVDDDCDGVVNEVGSAGAGCVYIPGRDPGGDGWVDIDFGSDLQNCGGCRDDCNPACDGTLCQADSCIDGRCTCDGGSTCGGGEDSYCCPDGCKNRRTDVRNCGGCGVVCPEPPCQTASCEGGVCRTDAVADGTPCGGGRYCCGGACAGDCPPGESDDERCGLCGRRERRCTGGCTWGTWGSCQGEGVCSFLDQDSDGCGNCGHKERTCGGDCQWEGWSPCFDQGCEPGEVNSRGCGNCGTETQTCRNDCTWGNWSGCGGEGACSPGQNEDEVCGRCGSRRRTCSQQCGWGAWGGCGGEGACTPGDRDPQTCGNCGSQERVCGADCEWGGFGNCNGQGECDPNGAPQSEPCGQLCGTRERSCTAACAWGNWSNCGNEGACQNGQTQDEVCGNCGTHSRTCANCQWPGWGNCTGEGDCTPNEPDTRPCTRCGTETRTCTSSCAWGDWGSCTGQGECTLGDTQSCGNCGTGSQACGPGCSWSGCVGETGCQPGDTQNEACSPPPGGSRSRTCTAGCQWGDWSTCS
ncbi:MAG: hypothetical protein HYY06_20920 [Deltaproteobacteria bacterium]|nr:hypothetical protein [Deltaproteobacteria bacterium]